MTKKRSFNKLAATSIAAAAAVAAVAPVAVAADTKSFPDVKVEDDHYKGITALTAQGIIKGYEDGTFGTYDHITRQQVAVMLSIALDLKTPDNVEEILSQYKDLDENHQYAKQIAAVTEARIFKGSQGEFGAGDPITREQMATTLVLGFELADLPAEEVKIKLDNVDSSHAKRVQVLANLGITNQTKDFRPKESISRGAFSTQLFKTQEAIANKDVQEDLEVESVSAINASTLEVTGAGLKHLEADNITVEGNGVSKVTVADDQKTARVTLTGVLAPNKDTEVAVKVNKETKKFTINYAFNAPDVAVQDGVYDDDTAGQELSVLIKGQAVTLDYLHTAGYTVEFRAFNESNANVTSSLFKTVTGNYSADGELKTDKTIGKYKVQLVLKKGSEVTTSDFANIEIRNLDNSATVSEDYKILTDDGISVTDTLVVGEKANFDELFVGNGDTVTKVNLDDKNAYSVVSSDSSVISVDPNHVNGFKAVGLGTATVKVTVGNAVQEVTINVKGEVRKATTVTGANVLQPIVGGNSEFYLSVLDQYGNGVVNPTSKIVESFPTSVDYKTGKSVDNAGVGRIKVTIPADKGGQTGTIVFKEINTDNVLGTATIKTSAINNKDNVKLQASRSNETIRANDARYTTLTYDLVNYNSENIYQGNFKVGDYTDYTVKFNEKIINVEGNTTGELTLDGSTEELEITAGKEAGSTKLSIYNKQGALVAETTVTVAQAETTITGVNWKTAAVANYAGQKVTYEDVLDITKASSVSDDIVNGLTFSSPVVNKVRIDKSTGDLYLDKNDNGVYDQGTDIVLATLSALVAPDQINLAPGKLDINTGLVGSDNPIISGSKGLIAFKLEQADTETVVGTTNVQVNVQPSDTQRAESQAIADLESKIANETSSAITLEATDFANLTANSVIKITKPMSVTVNAPTAATFSFDNTGTVASTITSSTTNTIGGLIVNTKNATFFNAANVIAGGTTTIVDVSNRSFINSGNAGKVIVKDTDGMRFENTVTGTVASLELAGKGFVKLDGVGTYPEVNVTGAGTTIDTAGNASNLTILVKAEDVKVGTTSIDKGNVATKAAGQEGVLDSTIDGHKNDQAVAAQEAVNAEAAKFTAGSVTVVQDKVELTLPDLTDGYTATIATSSNTDLIALDGTVATPASAETVDVKFTVTKTGTEYSAVTGEISVVVPQSTGGAAEAELTATTAVTEAETSKLSKDIEAATTLVIALVEGEAKTALEGRISAIEPLLEAPTDGSKSLAVEGVTASGALFLVAGLGEDSGKSQKPSTLAQAKTFIEETYPGVKFNTDAIVVTDGYITVEGTVLSTEDWNTVKASGDKTAPFRITLVKDNSVIGATGRTSGKQVAKVAMYQDGNTVIEDATK